MSNSLSVAVATRGLIAKIGEALATAPPGLGARVTALRPSGLVATEAAVNAFLYQVTPNAALRNADLPTRRASGELVARPQIALDLHYLLTFTGDEVDLIPQRILGVVLPALHAQPNLQRGEIDRLVQTSSPGFLDASDLAQQVELVRFSLGTMNLEELSKLWSVFFQTQYLLSVPLQASVVLLEAPLNPSPSQLVRKRAVYSGLPEPPRLTALAPPFASLAFDGEPPQLRLTGSGLLGQRTLVRFGASEPQVPISVESTQLVTGLPAGLRAGVHAVRVSVLNAFEQQGEVQPFDLESNTLAFALAPSILSESPLTLAGGVLELEVSPPVTRAQAVRVLLQRMVPSVRRFALNWAAPVTPPGEPIPTEFTTLRLALPAELDSATYFVRLEVDGVGSAIAEAPDAAPFVEVP